MIDNNFSLYVIDTYRSIEGEQETKNNLVEPFFKELGYDIDCVEDIRTEVTCDAGKKNEKVDYVLCIAGIPKIIVEAKDWKVELGEKYINQLFRYFSTSDCKMAILTNGLEYWFFSDFEKENIMDREPFYKLNVMNINKHDRKILNAICKVQQCSYPVEKFIIEQKTIKLLQNDKKLSEFIAMSYYNDLDTLEAVKNGIHRLV